jgi:glycosyltransferase involved in cell wall biosynthesis
LHSNKGDLRTGMAGNVSEVKACLICHPYYPSNDSGRGIDRYIYEICRNFESLSGRIELNVLHRGFSKTTLRGSGTKELWLVRDLVLTKADLYHAASTVGAKTAILLGKGPLITTVHDLIPFHFPDSRRRFEPPLKLWYRRFCTRLSIARSKALIVPFNVTKNELISRFKVAESKIHVINYGVDHDRYYPRSKSKGREKSILFLGSVTRAKGVDSLLKAFSIVERSTDGAKLLIGGTGSERQRMEELASDLKLKGVSFLGHIPEDELPTYYSSARAMIFPSRYGFGLSSTEAMACGCSVIVGNRLDAAEPLGDAGILIDPDSVEEMADAMLRLLTSEELREQLSRKAIERASLFSWQKMTQQTMEVYNKVMAKA